MTIRYKIHLSNQESVEIDAETINVGVNKFWLYDAENNLKAVFRWENIKGFSVEGSAAGQKVTDDLLHERKEADELEKSHGPVIAAIDQAQQRLDALERAVTNAWSKLRDARKEPKEIEFLLSKYPDRLRKSYIKLADYQRQLQLPLKMLIEDLETLFPKEK